MDNYYQHKVTPAMKNNPSLLAGLLFLLITLSILWLPTVKAAEDEGFRSFEAEYLVYRSGKKHGTAKRFLSQQNGQYQLGYSSDISWLLFSDKRSETSEFTLENAKITPLRYVMQRTGTGPNRYYELNLDPATKTLKTGKKKDIKAGAWQDNWLDPLSYHQQLVLDLKAGKTEFSYEVLNRHGDSKMYHYKAVAEEELNLPYGKLNTIRVIRVEDNNEKQVYAWLAPDLGYMLVRLWRGENNEEQFDVQLHKLRIDPPAQPNGSP